MCGIAGGVSLDGRRAVEPETVRAMLAMLRHRGPDAAGAWHGPYADLGHTRLAIIDVDGGLQPLANEDETVWVAVNGEVFNYVELTAQLRATGHRFRSRSDSEVIAHLYEEHGTDLLHHLNGQFAFALWDDRERRLMLARDRLGVRPLFYTVVDGVVLFASEVKSLLAHPQVTARLDLQSLDQVFTFWSMLPGRTMFEGIHELPPGHYLLAGPGDATVRIHRYWDLDFGAPLETDLETAASELHDALVDATRIRLRADVPVGAYLSGGLDSAAIAAIVRRHTSNDLQTFSVAFSDPDYDERRHQERMAAALGTSHHVVECGPTDIAAVFPDVVWHAEVPLLRTAPAPLLLLSRLVRDAGLKVVLTGEGADEMLAGYDIFKEALIRRFWARDPDSALRPLLLDRLYGWVPQLHGGHGGLLRTHFANGLAGTGDVAYSHLPRWGAAARLKLLFSPQVKGELSGYDSRAALDATLPAAAAGWDALSQAQYVETRTFLSSYLLSSQGDRMAMAHSVEGRFPFLDHRVVELAARIPARLRMSGLNEKAVLKHAVAGLVPDDIRRRPKQPYRAPVAPVFTDPRRPDYVDELLSDSALTATGVFDPVAVARLRAKCGSGRMVSELDGMALVGVLSTQLWHRQFVDELRSCSDDTFDVMAVGGAPLRAAV